MQFLMQSLEKTSPVRLAGWVRAGGESSQVSHSPTLWPVLPRESRQGWGGRAAACWTLTASLLDNWSIERPGESWCWGDGLEMWGHSHYLYSAALKYVWNQSKTCQQHVKPLSRMPGRRISVLTALKVWRNTKQNLRGRAWLGLTVCQSWSRGQIVIWRWRDPVLLGTLATENRSGKSSEKRAEIVINSNCSIWF